MAHAAALWPSYLAFLLLVVSFVPFPTSVLAEYLNGRALNAAAAF